MARSAGNCPLCEDWTQCYSDRDIPDVDHISCERCGKFALTIEFALNDLNRLDRQHRVALSAAARQANEEGSKLIFGTDNWRILAAVHYSSTISSKIDKLLRLLAKRSRRPGVEVRLDPTTDFPLIDAQDTQEFSVYANDCERKGLLAATQTGERRTVFRLTLDGWREVEPRTVSGGIPGRCFVVMSFDDTLDPAYREGIEPAIRDGGFTPIRMKEVSENKGISDRILAEIRLAEFVVADFTGQRQSVYFEAGFAHALGREVISCCHKGDVTNLHFDTKHLGHVLWESHDELRRKLTDSIRANIIKSA
jgi:hypothetical protein